jgi:hypothetical protein
VLESTYQKPPWTICSSGRRRCRSDGPGRSSGTARWKKLYRLRGAVERENGRLKNEWALLPPASSPH